jgi:hypothetical protein
MKPEDWESDFNIEKIIRLVEKIRSILAGNPSVIQGAVLAELTATWLSGHHAEKEEGNATVRARLLKVQVQVIKNLMALKH